MTEQKKKKQIHTPEGFRDVYGIACDQKQELVRRLERLLHTYGYMSVETPTLEYLSVFGEDVGTTSYRALYRFFDQQGDVLALRPDFTPAVARVASMYYAEEQLPLRFFYCGNVFRNDNALRGKLRENTQLGIEFLQDDSAEADAEILSLVITLMQHAGLSSFQITVGNEQLVRILLKKANLDVEAEAEVFRLLSVGNRWGAQAYLSQLACSSDWKDKICSLIGLFGDASVLQAAKACVCDTEAELALERMDRIHALLQTYGCAEQVSYDFGMATVYRYYTGVTFQAYTYGAGEPLLQGGRYDNLLEKYGKERPAIGFALQVDALLEALSRQNISIPHSSHGILLVYSSGWEEKAIRFADRQRKAGKSVTCMRSSLPDAETSWVDYGKRFRYDQIVVCMDENNVWRLDVPSGKRTEEDPDKLFSIDGKEDV